MKENLKTQGSDINETQLLRGSKQLLDVLLRDYTTGSNIKWGTDSYIDYGSGFQSDEEITKGLITGWYDGFIRPRAEKNKEDQQERQKDKAEVFTPSWVVKLQVDAAMEELKELPLLEFIRTKWIEITCGEAPYMVNRYDMTTGNVIRLDDRAGFMDVKFRRLNKEIQDEKAWLEFALEIYKSSYGYEYQGDSLLLARENLMLTFIDNYFYMFGAFPENKLILEISKIVSINVFQMDGLTYEIPFSEGRIRAREVQLDLFQEFIEEEEKIEPKFASIRYWDKQRAIEFKNIIEGNEGNMKFDVAIGNPPYQVELEGTSARPIYPMFMDASYDIADKSLLITPARFLFNAGKTSKAWNNKMLNDDHLKVIYYEPFSPNVFENTDIKGGISITYRDKNKTFGPIKVFTAFEELASMLNKVNKTTPQSFSEIIYSPESYKLTEELHEDFPSANSKLSKGHKYDVTTNIFEKLPEVFKSNKPVNSNGFMKVFGRFNNTREYRWVKSKYITGPENLSNYKVFIPKSNGSGALGEVLSTPMIGQPMIGHTQTFLSIGNFRTEDEAMACMKYIKSKFVRTMLGILKVTQHNPSSTWLNVPLQDFTSNSEIDWSKSAEEVDQQLYRRYDLSQEEINFIETNIKEME